MTLREVVPLIESGWSDVHALVIGDVMLDKYIWGEVERISPEAPVPVVRGNRQCELPGGAANVAMNLAGLGARATVLGFGGGDTDQRRLEELLIAAGVEAVLKKVEGIPTTSKLRVLAGNQQMLRLDTEVKPQGGEAAYADLLDCVFAFLPGTDVIVLSDYAKGVLTVEVCRAIIEAANSFDIPVLVDPKNRNFIRYHGATTICPNLKELSVATGESVHDLDRLFDAGQALLPWLNMSYMTVTCAEKGIAVLRQKSRSHAAAVVRQVYDVSGAGDTVIAVLALAMASKLEIEAAVQLANLAAGVVVSKVGTVAIQRHDLLGALSHEIALHPQEKVVSLPWLRTRVTAWRSAGERVVFTNGCFDILHVGHIALLEQARRQGDRLIVAINSDESVRRLKGPSRPIVCARERAQILAVLSAVDAVIVFDDPTPLRLIEAFRPDVLVKGGDYAEEEVIGAPEVRSWGGRVELIPIVEGSSTTRLIERAMAYASD